MKYRKKPVVIEAVQWTGFNTDEISDLFGEKIDNLLVDTRNLQIVTLEGVMKASLDDYIIKGIKGEFYPCKPDIFLATYEPIV